MAKVNLSELPFSKFTKIWLFIYIAFNFVWGIYSICRLQIMLPCVLFALVNIIAITFILRMNKRSLYLLLSETFLSLIFAFFLAKGWDGSARLLVLADFFFKCVTWLSIRSHYEKFKL